MTGLSRSHAHFPTALGLLALALTGCTDDEPASGGRCEPGVNCSTDGTISDIVAGDSGAPTFDSGTAASDAVLPGANTDSLPAVDAGLNAGGFPCEVQKVLADKCTLCHAQGEQGPMPLTSPEHFLAAATSDRAKRVYEVVRERILHDDPRARMPPTSQEPLTSDELAILTSWLDQGAPSSDERCGSNQGGEDPPGPVNLDGLDCYDIRAHAPNDKTAKYQVGTARDSYMVFEFAAPWQGTAYPIYIESIVDNPAVLHHWLLYLVNNPRDGSARPSLGQGTDAEFMFGWAPGGVPLDMREHGDVGFEVGQGQGLRLEIHYNSSDPNAQDASGAKVCIAKDRPTNIATTWWVGVDNLIPSPEWTGLCDPISEEPIHILGVTPHMHLKGIHMKGVINRADGSQTVLHDAPFSFDDQTFYRKNETLMPGDTITTTCTYSEPKSFGQGTEQEMCYLFALAYPKDGLSDIGGLLGWGALAHGANSCVGALPL